MRYTTFELDDGDLISVPMHHTDALPPCGVVGNLIEQLNEMYNNNQTEAWDKIMLIATAYPSASIIV